jgi:hypothetical protein
MNPFTSETHPSRTTISAKTLHLGNKELALQAVEQPGVPADVMPRVRAFLSDPKSNKATFYTVTYTGPERAFVELTLNGAPVPCCTSEVAFRDGLVVGFYGQTAAQIPLSGADAIAVRKQAGANNDAPTHTLLLRVETPEFASSRAHPAAQAFSRMLRSLVPARA